MKTHTVHWEKVSQENPLTLMRRGQLQKLCREHGIEYDAAKTTARELRMKLKEKGIDGYENASQ